MNDLDYAYILEIKCSRGTQTSQNQAAKDLNGFDLPWSTSETHLTSAASFLWADSMRQSCVTARAYFSFEEKVWT